MAKVVFSDDGQSGWKIEMQGIETIRAQLSGNVLPAFLKIFVSIDRLRMITSLIPYENLDSLDGPGGDRKTALIPFLQVSALFESKSSIAELNKALSQAPFASRIKPELRWLSDIKKEIDSGRLGEAFKSMRNQAGHHFGDLCVYKRGLDQYNEDDLLLYQVGKDDVFDNFFVGAHQILMLGLDDVVKVEIDEILAAIQSIEGKLRQRSLDLFLEVLKLCDVTVKDRRAN